jgi:hypothetical protein
VPKILISNLFYPYAFNILFALLALFLWCESFLFEYPSCPLSPANLSNCEPQINEASVGVILLFNRIFNLGLFLITSMIKSSCYVKFGFPFIPLPLAHSIKAGNSPLLLNWAMP